MKKSSFFILALLFLYKPPSVFAADGKTLYRLYCTQCHGLKGNGKGINSAALLNNPQNHTDVNYMSTKTDLQLEEVIRFGGIGVSKSPIMPAWKNVLTDEEIRALVKHLRVLCACKFESITSDSKLRSVDPSFK